MVKSDSESDVVTDVKNRWDQNNNPYDYYIAGDHMQLLRILKFTAREEFDTDDVGPTFIREFKSETDIMWIQENIFKKGRSS